MASNDAVTKIWGVFRYGVDNLRMKQAYGIAGDGVSEFGMKFLGDCCAAENTAPFQNRLIETCVRQVTEHTRRLWPPPTITTFFAITCGLLESVGASVYLSEP